MIDSTIETQFHDFRNQIYPTNEETIVNNRSILYKRKKFFLNDLKTSVKLLGILLIIVLYLRDLSMIRLLLRGFIQASLANPFPTATDNVSLSDENKRALTKFLLVGVLVINGFCMLMHLLFSVYHSENNSYLHGGISLQFIGERLPSSRFELLSLDIAIVVLQLLYHSLMCVIDDSTVLQLKPAENEDSTIDSHQDAEASKKAQLESDGYNGNVMLMSINVVNDVRTVLAFEEKLVYSSLSSQNTPLSTAFPTPGAFV